MATDTAAAPAATDPTTHLWQLPALLVGAAVFVSAWQGWLPVGRSDPSAVFKRDVDALKASYDKLAPDPGELKNHLGKVAGAVDSFPEHAAAARFHLGSGYVRLAEVTPAGDEARGYWTLARQHLERVKGDQLRDPNDASRRDFRAAKAEAAVGLPTEAPPAQVALLLTVLKTPPPGEEGGETKRLAADLALRQNPPDLAFAKVALSQYLVSAGPATPGAALARAKLKLGAIFLVTREFDQARKWLGQIGADAPPDVLAPAKAELARVLMGEGDYLGATRELEALRAVPSLPANYRLGSAYDLAVCKLRTREPDAAVKLFEEAVKGTGDEAVAAAVQLAELYLRGPDPAKHLAAAELLAGAVKGVTSASAFKNDFVPVGDVQGAFALAVATLLKDGAYDQALQAAGTFAAVAAVHGDREKRAEVLSAWGEALKKASPADAALKFKAAADEFAALAGFQANTGGKLELLRRAAALYREAGEPAAAAARLKEAVKLPSIPDATAGPLWLELADALLAANQTAEVLRAFNEVMAAGGYAGTAARYRLARQFADSRHPGLVPVGRALFEQIANQQNVPQNEREFHERALTELANDLIRQGTFADAEARLRTQLQLYPSGPEAALARLLLGVCLLQKAAAPTVAAPDALRFRTEAIGTFKQLVTECDAAERRNGKLTEREGWLRLQAALRVLQTYQQMRKPQDLLYEAAPLLDRYKGTVEELIVLSLVYHAFKQSNNAGEMQSTRERMKDVFDKLPPSAFPQKAGEYSREYWQKEWFAPPPN